MTILPIIALGVILTLFTINRFTKSIHSEVQENMKNMAYTVANSYDIMYPGEYSVAKSDSLIALKKGEHLFGSRDEYLECIKEDTDMDITLFYNNVRMVSTLSDEDGNDLTGTAVNTVIRREVLEEDSAKFYSSAIVNDVEYFAYYMPVHDAAGEAIGIIAVVKEAKEVKSLVLKSVRPIYIIAVIVMIVAGAFCILFSQRIIKDIDKISNFLYVVEHGDLSQEIDYKLKKRDDELGEMAVGVSNMQAAIKQLTEHDVLTTLYNRRYANARLNQIRTNYETSGVPYSVCIADIDFFKKINDVYGHDAGDAILVAISDELKKTMTGKGFAARWGGEEFLLVFDKSGIEETTGILENTRNTIEKMVIEHGDNHIGVTMSFGAAVGSRDNLEMILKKADDKLYEAKEHGRNRVVS